MNSNQFRNGFAIFQGGGCKAIAYLGAYEEALNQGIYFSEFAGTSAGAIFAALLAAGATVDQLKEIVEQGKLEEFKSKRVKKGALKTSGNKRKIISLINFFLKCRGKNEKEITVLRYILKSIQYSGVYSSKGVEDWLDKNLQKVLNKTDDVFFKDLKFPLTILAADIQNQCVKIWSKSNTPEIKVSYAVRCSCTIPIFYQPVDNQYVDGGILSNLPTYLLDQRSVFTEVYAFGFESKKAVSKIEKIEMYYENIMNTIVSGNIEIQLSISDDQKNYIKIDTGDIGATDFNKIFHSSTDIHRVNWLIDQGRKATREFFEKKTDCICSTQKLHLNNTEIFNWIVNEALNYNYDKVYFCIEDLTLTQSLFPLFFKWKKERKEIFLGINNERLFENLKSNPLKNSLLKEISILQKLKSEYCFITFVKEDKIKSAIVWDINKIEKAAIYQKTKDGPILNSLFNLVTNIFSPTIKYNHGNLILKELLNTNTITEALKKVKVYKDDLINISFEKIKIKNLFFLTNYVKGYKYRMVDIISSYIIDKQLKNDSIYYIEMNNSDLKSVITPPVIEEHEGKYYVIEGNCRCYYQKQMGIPEIYCIVVRGVHTELPSSKIFSLKELIVVDMDARGKYRYEGFSYSLFRDIENAIHS